MQGDTQGGVEADSGGCSSHAFIKNDGGGVSVEDHPLFINRVPSEKDFRDNPLLSALAALIDEDEETQPEHQGPQRRQRRKIRSSPWTSKRRNANAIDPAPTDRGPGESVREVGGHRAGSYSAVEPLGSSSCVSDPSAGRGGQREEGRESDKGRQELRVPHQQQYEGRGDMQPQQQPAGASLGELQICMRLFSLK
ncbi:hypothetical protein cyc_01524 [Cyclospora cayetanensis]|uniref:Uncharacterized protein n=1 Tax=Cyclospora cayetanensis TaxID=88456 RepID=A0A1D3D6Y1_9EIME|nr:hypothetical protein cyc_01524 [Cyclospora cayetanensis]